MTDETNMRECTLKIPPEHAELALGLWDEMGPPDKWGEGPPAWASWGDLVVVFGKKDKEIRDA